MDGTQYAIKFRRGGTNLILTRAPSSAIDASRALIGTPEQLLTQLVQHTIPFRKGFDADKGLQKNSRSLDEF